MHRAMAKWRRHLPRSSRYLPCKSMRQACMVRGQGRTAAHMLQRSQISGVENVTVERAWATPGKASHTTSVEYTVVVRADVLVFAEPWMDCDEDIPACLEQGFRCHAAHGERPEHSGRGMGGVLVCVKRYLNSSLYKCNAKAGIVWVKIPRCGSGRDIYIAACY